MGCSRSLRFTPSRASESPEAGPDRSRRTGCRIAPLLVAGVAASLSGLFPPPAGASVFTVGAGGDCSAPSLAIALLLTAANGTGQDEIRLTANQVGNFTIFNQSVSIVGGWANCSAPGPSGVTTITSPGTGRVFSISGATSFRSVELVHLDITGGVALYGGGIYILDKFVVSLYDTWIFGNQANSGGAGAGGGIAIDGNGGARLAIDQGSRIHDNSALTGGGGIYCQETVPASAGVTLIDGLVDTNSAVSYGAGIAVRGCELLSFAGGPQKGIRNNTTPGDGGGIYADTLAHVELWGDTAHPATLDANSANGGSALYVWGPDVDAELHDSWVTNQPAGDAFVARDGGRISMDRTLGSDCPDPFACSRIAGNLDGVGSGDISLSHTVVEDNAASAALLLLQTDSSITLDSVIFARNTLSGGAGGRLLQWNGKDLHVTHTTFVDNLAAGQYLIWTACGDCYPAPQTLSVDTTLMAEANGTVLAPAFDPADYSIAFDCVILRETASLPPSALLTRSSLAANPDLHFVDRAGGDFHLRVGSPAIDFCSAPPGDIPLDIEFQPFGFDEPAAANLHGIWDLGADEEMPGLFADGFETGNTGRWSSSHP
jgi:hypothetical protein